MDKVEIIPAGLGLKQLQFFGMVIAQTFMQN